MVGSVLMQRMRECGDFEHVEASFFSTSAAGQRGPTIGKREHALGDAFDVAALSKLPVLLSCQGADYTNEVYPRLRAEGWNGYFIDASKALRMKDDAVLILDPVNRKLIDAALARGIKTYCGPICTVSILVMETQGLFEAGLVEWVSTMTYQAASGAGAQQMRELIAQMDFIAKRCRTQLDDPAATALEIDALVTDALRSEGLPRDSLGVPLAGSLIPWIDKAVAGGQTLEEWKSHAEGNKILGNDPAIPIDGQCVRVGAMRSHAHGLTVKLKKDVPLPEVARLLAGANDWVRVIDNDREATLRGLTPAAVTGTLEIAVGRLRKLQMGPEYLGAFAVGDQLLWGAAEPLRRMLGILREHRAA
jgi:aspartate-semialdehyde dehydrogenase